MGLYSHATNHSYTEFMKYEVERLHSHAQLVTDATFKQKDRQVPYGVRAATAMIKTML